MRSSKEQGTATLLSAIAINAPCINKQIDVKAIAVSNGSIDYRVANDIVPRETDDPQRG